jgi:hypothetical protein
MASSGRKGAMETEQGDFLSIFWSFRYYHDRHHCYLDDHSFYAAQAAKRKSQTRILEEHSTT